MICSEFFELDSCDVHSRPLMKIQWTNKSIVTGKQTSLSFIESPEI